MVNYLSQLTVISENSMTRDIIRCRATTSLPLSRLSRRFYESTCFDNVINADNFLLEPRWWSNFLTGTDSIVILPGVVIFLTRESLQIEKNERIQMYFVERVSDDREFKITVQLANIFDVLKLLVCRF